MAATPGVGTIYQYTIQGTKAGQRWMMGTLLSPAATPSNPDYIGYCTSMLAAQYSGGSPLWDVIQACTAGTSFVSQTLQAIYPTRLVRVSAVNGAGYTSGALGGIGEFPPNVAGTFERFTELGTRYGKGNLHPPVGRADQLNADGSWIPAMMALMTTMANGWRQPFFEVPGIQNLYPVLWRKTAPTIISRFIGVNVNPYARTMRRRTPGLGI